jgi:hypothetical protein
VVDRLAAPGPLDHRVRKPEDEDVLHRLLAHVMVDPKYPRLVKDLAHNSTELLRAVEVVPDRLLEHDPRVLPEAPRADSPDDRREGRGRRSAIKQPPTFRAKLGVERYKAPPKPTERVRVVERRGHVRQTLGERLPASPIQAVARELLDPPANAVAEARVVEAASARTDDRIALRQQPLVGKVIQRRKQLPAGQIARRAKHNQRLRRRRDKSHSGHQPSSTNAA